MKIRYRNRSTGEARDIDVGSAEETTVKVDVFTVNGESLPLWVPDAEYKQIQAQEANMSTAQAVFGSHSRRLTPGEKAMGIKSYEQKIRENDPDALLDEEDEDEEIIEPTTTEAVNPADAHHDESEDEDDEDDEEDDEEEDDEEEDDDDKTVTAPKTARQPRRAPRRAPARSR